MHFSASDSSVYATLARSETEEFEPRTNLSSHILSGVIEYYDAQPKSLVEVKNKATGESGSLTPEQRQEYGKHPLRLMAVSLADFIAAEIYRLSVDERRPREALQAVMTETGVTISSVGQEQLRNALAQFKR